MSEDIVERLRAGALEWMYTDNKKILLNDAADEIERLRTLCGKAYNGESFAEITRDVPRRMPQPGDD